MKLLALRGISGSGKSTYAEELRKQGWVVVSRDAIRETMFKDYASTDEDVVTVVEDEAIASSLKAGHNVVVDDTNIRTKYLKRFARIAFNQGADFDVKQFDIDVTEAVRRVGVRGAQGGRFVPADVIKKQAQGLKHRVSLAELYEEQQVFRPYAPPPFGEVAILVDVDGTLAHNNGHRGWYDYDKVINDELKNPIAEIVRQHAFFGIKVIIMSGRDDDCKAQTIEWLTKNLVPFDEIHMRRTGDQRRDSIVKAELFDQYIRDRFDVKFVLDDRNQVVDMWRSLGLTCLQVQAGNY